MIELKSLELENFMGIESAKINLDDQGIVFISGRTPGDSALPSNSSGKSRLLASVPYSLWGRTTKEIQDVSGVISRGEQECRSRLAGTIQGEPFVIERHRTKKGGSVTFSHSGTTRIPDTQEEINRVFGTFDLFRNTVFLGQMEALQFIEATDSGKKAVLEDLLKLRIYRDARAIGSQDKLFFTQKLESLRQRAVAAQMRLDKSLSEIVHSWQLLKAKAEFKAQGELDLLKEQIESAVKEYEGLADTLISNQSQIEELDKEKSGLENNLGKVQRALLEKTGLIMKIDQGLHQAKKNLQSYRDRKVCELCGQEVTQNPTRIEELEASVSEWEKSRAPEDSEKARLAQEVETQTLTLQGFLKTYQDRRSPLLEPARKVELLQGQIFQMKRKLDELQQKKRDSEVNLNLSIAKDLERAFPEWIRIKQEEFWCTRMEKRIEEVLPYLRFWDEGFSFRGLPAFLIEESLPLITSQANFFLDIFTDGRLSIKIDPTTSGKNGKEREELSFTVFDSGDEEVLNNCSAGEQKRIIISILLALSDIQGTLTGTSWNLREMDEIFESLDFGGIERVPQILGILKKTVPSIFVVTHRSELYNSGYFDHHWDMVRTGNTTKLEVVA